MNDKGEKYEEGKRIFFERLQTNPEAEYLEIIGKFQKLEAENARLQTIVAEMSKGEVTI